MDVTTLGGLLVGLGAVGAAVASYLGKRSENRTTSLNSAFDQIQEERDGLRTGIAERDARIAELLEERLADQVELARLQVKIIQLGGDPS
ncbi:hypothetical protein [Streptomyces sp. NPDC047070]|uniref:hypothetical protein n=1 Tax=Streptomyces sp. NPDC047070 TaxID=3154923 RepID=UPI00345615D0